METKSETPRLKGLAGGLLSGTGSASKARKRAKGGVRAGSVQLPPLIESTLTVKSKIRYVSGSDSIVSVSVADLIGSFGGVCTVVNSVFKPWASSCRIRRIMLWPSTTAGGNNSANISWNSGISGLNRDSEKSKDVPEGTTITGEVKMVPPAKALASEWMSGSASGNIFTLTCNTGSLMDVEAEFTLANQFTSSTQTIATGVLGNIYYLPLDGASSHTYFPVHLPTTF